MSLSMSLKKKNVGGGPFSRNFRLPKTNASGVAQLALRLGTSQESAEAPS